MSINSYANHYSSAIVKKCHDKNLHAKSEIREKLRNLRRQIRNCFDKSVQKCDSTYYLEYLFFTYAHHYHYWYETPEKAISSFQKFYDLNNQTVTYPNMIYDKLNHLTRKLKGEIWLVSWDGSDNAKVLDQKWNVFIKDLLSNKNNKKDYIFGLILSELSNPSDKSKNEILKYLWEQKEDALLDDYVVLYRIMLQFLSSKDVLQKNTEYCIKFLEFLYGQNKPINHNIEKILVNYICRNGINIYTRKEKDKIRKMKNAYLARKGKTSFPIPAYKNYGFTKANGKKIKILRKDIYDVLELKKNVTLSELLKSNKLYLFERRSVPPIQSYNRIWLHVVLQASNYKDQQAIIISLDPVSLTSECIKIPKELEGKKIIHDESWSRFDVSEKYIAYIGCSILIGGRHIIIYDRKSKKWKWLASFFYKVSALKNIGEYIYLGFHSTYQRTGEPGSSGIMQINIKTGKTKLLASERMKPSISPLDDQHFSHVFFLESSEDKLRFSTTINKGGFSGTQIYEYDITNGRWEKPLPYYNSIHYYINNSPGGSLLYNTWSSRLLYLPEEHFKFKHLFYRGWSSQKKKQLLEKYEWVLLKDAPTLSVSSRVYDGRNMWLLAKEKDVYLIRFFQKNSKNELQVPISLMGGKSAFFHSIYYTSEGLTILSNEEEHKGKSMLSFVPFDEINSFIRKKLPLPEISGECVRFYDSTKVTISTDISDAEIRYTVDGTIPTRDSLLYEKPVKLTNSSLVRARILKNGYFGSDTANSKFRKFRLIDPVNIKDKLINGLKYKYYEGKWEKIPYFDSMKPIKSGYTKKISLGMEKRNEDFGFLFSGYIEIKKDGIYTFYTKSNDGSILYIDGMKVVWNDGIHRLKERFGSIALKTGKHPISLTFFDANGKNELEVCYEGPGRKKQEVPPNILFHVEGNNLAHSCLPQIKEKLSTKD